MSLVFLDGASWDRERGLIAGERWTPAGWTAGRFPLPDLVVIKTAAGDQWGALDGWIRRNRPVIADSGLDKLAFHALLSGSPLMRHAIPTVAIPADAVDATLAAVFREHRNAVVKPADGRRGFGIQFIHNEPGAPGLDGPQDGVWRVQHGQGLFRGALDDAVAHVRSRIAGRLRYRRYLVQRFIRSVAGDGRPADIRVHVQRRADGAWGVTRAYVRLAEAGTFLTNTSQGGYQGPLDGFLLGRRVSGAADLRDRIPALALEVARLVDATKPLPLSELGIDLAVDDDDRLWVIEANALPQSSLHEQARAEHAIGYAIAVARGQAGHARPVGDGGQGGGA
ncbi:YheC/YheD family protein [Azospirillum sp. TSO35-2]|uniref:YheC/YheD family protein n=1 Tax=Azospirillum sp. TSO35-2 TaxID=716796 RepID=UPI001FFE9D80|nr:YheC/YheD family protein [Azospirillum sp. TSO35-2]